MLYAHAKEDARPSPTDDHPNRLIVDLKKTFLVCHQHEIEQQVYTNAVAKGWPLQHDWSKVEQRVQDLVPHLSPILTDTDGARLTCHFWQKFLILRKDYSTPQIVGSRSSESFAQFHPG